MARNATNARGLPRQDNYLQTDAQLDAYVQAILNLGPVNTETQAARYRDILRDHAGIDIFPVGDDSFGAVSL